MANININIEENNKVINTPDERFILGIDITDGTVMGDMKLQYVMENIENKTLEEFEEFFKK